MKPHTPDQVAAMKSFVDSQPSVDRKTYILNGLEVAYTTVDMSDRKPFDYAVAAFVAPNMSTEPIAESDYEIAVSDDVPEQFQGLWAWHELHDFAVLGHEVKDRCLQSEQEVANNLASDPYFYVQYLAVRLKFYKNLTVFIVKDIREKGQSSAYDKADVQGCIDCIKFLIEQIPYEPGQLRNSQSDMVAMSWESLGTEKVIPSVQDDPQDLLDWMEKKKSD